MRVSFPAKDLPGSAGARVDAFLTARLHGYSRAAVQRLIGEGRVFLGGRPAKAGRRLGPADVVIIRYPRREDPPSPHAALAVLFEDRRLLAVDKPARVLSHPTDKVARNSATAILAAQFPGRKLHLVHRLDRETSGVLLLAKDGEAARLCAEAFAARLARKEYLAVVSGRVEFRRRRVDAPIGGAGGDIKIRQAAGGAGARGAVTEFERLAGNAKLSLLRAVPLTGRLHQIRVHLAELGHPVLGDKLYRADGWAYRKAVRGELTEDDIGVLGAPRQLLHAFRLSLPHPETGRELSIRAPLPEDFERALSGAGLRNLRDIDK